MNNTRWARPESLLEVYSWIFMRVSGVVLVVLALGHLAIMHLINNVDIIDYDFVAQRFVDAVLADLRFHPALAGHAARPERRADHDRRLSDRPRLADAGLSVLAVVGVVFLTLGSLVIVTFQPVAGGQVKSSYEPPVRCDHRGGGRGRA